IDPTWAVEYKFRLAAQVRCLGRMGQVGNLLRGDSSLEPGVVLCGSRALCWRCVYRCAPSAPKKPFLTVRPLLILQSWCVVGPAKVITPQVACSKARLWKSIGTIQMAGAPFVHPR